MTFWLDSLGMDRAQFVEYLGELGIYLDARAHTLPKGTLRRSPRCWRQNAVRSRGSSPIPIVRFEVASGARRELL